MEFNDLINACESLIIPDSDQLTLVLEAKLNTADRDQLPDGAFGLPKQRKYPLIVTKPEDRTPEDKDGGSHIRNAISFFHFCKEEDRKELAANIMKAIKKNHLNIEIAKNNIIRKYVEVPA